jgi:GntR family transcriptional regulator
MGHKEVGMSIQDEEASIDKDSVLPIYFQLENIFREKIKSGEWKNGERIPSESALCKTFNVSRNTVRKAIGDLINEGVLYIEQGKGTFVTQQIFNYPTERLFGFSEEMKKKHIRPGAKILEKKAITAPKDVERILRTPTVYRIKRLRLADGKPIAIEDAYLPESRFENLIDGFSDNMSLYETLKTRFGVQPFRAVETIEASMPTETERLLLKIKKGVPLLRICRKTFLRNGEIIEFVKAAYRSDVYRITLNLKRL